MTDLGALGDPTPDGREITFTYFGETTHVAPELGELDYIDFMERAGAMDVESPAALAMVKDFARLCIAAEDFDRFWAAARKNRQTVEGVFKVLRAIIEEVTDRPTMQPSDSSDGQSSTDTKSEPGLSSTLRERLDGRPDLQLFVQSQQVAAG